ncbi:hypothetical protein ROJ8625_00508 [Roseivivax jejudonensis]|uniref:Uncharacterized protein n=1 Tax=Roseivivax jejudonensis TaxID=1529041 RepID=A0A1X6YB62_9RHOB|nr:hypothetical protein [Roseivivax jejudonensis]SLN15667.1 hypothetical protein ROJ8625_00508 [Roseivivax jejudonensis]
MTDIRDTIKRVWTNLNPSEPSPWFLLKLWVFMVSCMFVALIIGLVT